MPLDNSNNMQEADFLYGANAIAAFLDMKPRQVHHLRETGQLPLGKIGGRLFALKSQLRNFMNSLISAEVVTHD